MTLEEQRQRLAILMADAMAHIVPKELGDVLDMALVALASISAAGFSIFGPEVTEDMADAGWEKMREIENRDGSFPSDACLDIWRAMLAAGDITRKPK